MTLFRKKFDLKLAMMIEVFTTNIKSDIQAELILKKLKTIFPELKINFDVSNTELPYPCGHSILRIEGKIINSESIIATIKQSGFMCGILEDKVCS